MKKMIRRLAISTVLAVAALTLTGTAALAYNMTGPHR